MTRFPSARSLVFFLLAIVPPGPGPAATALQAAPATGPLRVHPANPRYFADGSGRAVYLTGSHVWQNLKDIGPTDPPPAFDFNGYLDMMESTGQNFIRLWTWDLSRSQVDIGVTPWLGSQYVLHFPWPRTGPGTALDGKPKFDLGAFNPAYFDRLRSRIVAARDRGIYVSIMLFEGWALHSADGAWRWGGHPFHASNNINGINGNPNGDGYGTEIQTLPGPAGVNAVQKAYVRKVIDTVNDLDNVLYEVANESGNHSTAWQYDMIDSIKSYQAGKPRQHPVGMTFQWGALGAGSNADLFNSPADWISPNTELVSDGSKVVLHDTDHINPWETDPAYVWRTFMRGGNPIVMDHHDGAKWDPIRRAMGHARSYAGRANLAATTPQGGLSSTGFCLAAPGSEYLVYQPGSGGFTLDVQPGTYAFEWFNVGTGTVAGTGSVTAPGGGQTFTPPFGGKAVLYLKAGGGGPPPPPPPPIPGGFVGHWTFDEGAGTVAGDATGNGNDGTLANGPTWTPGSLGGAVRLDGADDHVRVASSASLDSVAAQLTIASWVYREADQSGWRIVATRQLGSGYDDQYFLGFHDNAYRFGVHTTSGYPLVSGGAAPNGQWIHLAGTYDGAAVRLYVDGAPAGSAGGSGSILLDAKPLLLGAGRNDATTAVQEALAGRLDDVRLYNRALGESEIAALAQGLPLPGTGAGAGLTGEYYDTIDFTGPALFRTDARVDFDWGAGSPDASLGPDTFSVRWTGRVEAPSTETYTFYVRTDDGVRLWVDGQLLVDAWLDQAATERSQTIALEAGRKVDLKLEYYENGGNASARLSWSSASTPKEPIPADRLFIHDADGDGVADAQEVAQGTDPNDPGAAGGGGGSDGGGSCGATGMEALLLLLAATWRTSRSRRSRWSRA